MASLLCVPSSLPLTSATKTKSGHQLQQKPNSLISCSSPRSQEKPQKSVLPFFSLTHGSQTHISSRTPTTTTKVSTVSQNSTAVELEQTVEHIVFLQMRDPENKSKEEAREALMTALNSLRCLPGTLYLTAGPVQDTYGAPSPFNFFLHSRLATKKHRDRFMQHPLKYGFSMGYTEGLCDDFMMLDYIHDHVEPLKHPVFGTALRFAFLKLKDGVDVSSLREVVESSFPGSVLEPTFGSIIEPCFTVPGTQADAVKGYNFAMHGTYFDKAALDKLGSPEAFANSLNKKIGEKLVDDKSVFIHDYDIHHVYGGTFV